MPPEGAAGDAPPDPAAPAARRAHAARAEDSWVPAPPGPLQYNFVRIAMRLLISCYLRVRLEGADRLPTDSTYLVNFSHPSWIDPPLVVAFWPDKRWVYIFGPREADMHVGARNRVIRWARIGVPFKPAKSDLLDTTRRAVGVLKRGFVLAVAGEGRLSDEEGAIIPLEEGPAFFALRAQVPIVPMVVIGTRWLRFGKRVTLRIGEPVPLNGRRANREGVASLTAEVQAAMERLLVGVVGEPPPGPFGRWLTDVFNERPWLDEQRERDDPAT